VIISFSSRALLHRVVYLVTQFWKSSFSTVFQRHEARPPVPHMPSYCCASAQKKTSTLHFSTPNSLNKISSASSGEKRQRHKVFNTRDKLSRHPVSIPKSFTQYRIGLPVVHIPSQFVWSQSTFVDPWENNFETVRRKNFHLSSSWKYKLKRASLEHLYIRIIYVKLLI
jgi:hypothetical protein